MFGFLCVLTDNHIIIINDVCVWLGTVNTGIGYTAALTHTQKERAGWAQSATPKHTNSYIKITKTLPTVSDSIHCRLRASRRVSSVCAVHWKLDWGPEVRWWPPAFVAAAGPRSCLPQRPEEAPRGPTSSGEGPGMSDTLHFLAAGERRVWFRMSGVCHLKGSTGDKSLTNNGELMKNIPTLTRADLCNLFFWSL